MEEAWKQMQFGVPPLFPPLPGETFMVFPVSSALSKGPLLFPPSYFFCKKGRKTNHDRPFFLLLLLPQTSAGRTASRKLPLHAEEHFLPRGGGGGRRGGEEREGHLALLPLLPPLFFFALLGGGRCFSALNPGRLWWPEEAACLGVCCRGWRGCLQCT